MKFLYLKNSKGLTLTELIVAMGLTSVLTVIVISGSLFIQKYINRWTGDTKLLEEALFVQAELKDAMERAKVVKSFSDSLICLSQLGGKEKYSWLEGYFKKNERVLLKKGVKVDFLRVSRIRLHDSGSVFNLQDTTAPEVPGLYRLLISVSEKGKRTDTISTIVRCDYEYLKFNQ